MDRKIEKKKWTQKRLLYIIGTAFFVLLMFFGFKSFNKKIYKVDASRISVKKVVEDNFQDMIFNRWRCRIKKFGIGQYS